MSDDEQEGPASAVANRSAGSLTPMDDGSSNTSALKRKRDGDASPPGAAETHLASDMENSPSKRQKSTPPPPPPPPPPVDGPPETEDPDTSVSSPMPDVKANDVAGEGGSDVEMHDFPTQPEAVGVHGQS